MIGKIGNSIVSTLRTIVFRSAVDPLLWLCGITTLPTIFLYIILRIPPNFYFFISFLPVLAVFIAYFYFMLKNPSFLRSEKHQIQQRALELLGERGKEFTYVDGELKLSVPDRPQIHRVLPEIKEEGEIKK